MHNFCTSLLLSNVIVALLSVSDKALFGVHSFPTQYNTSFTLSLSVTSVFNERTLYHPLSPLTLSPCII